MKCTIQDIAKELKLSRNTVSKALKNSEEVSLKTRKRVLEKAKEMQYVNSDLEDHTTSDNTNKGSILFLTRTHANDSEFWASVLKGIESVLSAANYRLIIGIMTEQDLNALKFPSSIHDPSIKGIIIVEICYESVCKALLNFNIPIVTVDMPRNYFDLIGKFDIVTMENKINIRRITNHLIAKGARQFSFIGDLYSLNVGRGFQERYDALCECLEEADLKLDMSRSILHATNENFRNFDYVIEKLKQIPSLPDVFICGNDWTALQIMYGLQSLGYNIPTDVSIVGFDNIPASERISPSLTTISTPKEYLGIASARQIIDRINHPNTPRSYSQFATELIIRNSTI